MIDAPPLQNYIIRDKKNTKIKIISLNMYVPYLSELRTVCPGGNDSQ